MAEYVSREESVGAPRPAGVLQAGDAGFVERDVELPLGGKHQGQEDQDASRCETHIHY
jgi:hypothetical protein